MVHSAKDLSTNRWVRFHVACWINTGKDISISPIYNLDIISTDYITSDNNNSIKSGTKFEAPATLSRTLWWHKYLSTVEALLSF